MKPEAKGTLEILDLIRREDAMFVRVKGETGPFRVMGSKTGKFVSATKISAEDVSRLFIDNWIKITGKSLIEAYAITDVGIARLKEPQKKVPLRRGMRRRQFQKGPDLDVSAIKAWQRFQESYELACIEDPNFRAWDGELTYGSPESWGPFNGLTGNGTQAGKLRETVSFLGPDLSNALLHFFCLGKGLEDMEKKLNWPARSGKLVVAIAARHLVGYYG